MNDGAIDLTADPQATHLATILGKNKEACDKLCMLGFKGNLFRMNSLSLVVVVVSLIVFYSISLSPLSQVIYLE